MDLYVDWLLTFSEYADLYVDWLFTFSEYADLYVDWLFTFSEYADLYVDWLFTFSEYADLYVDWLFIFSEYVDLYVDWLLNKSIYPQFKAFYHGFHTVCASNALIVSKRFYFGSYWRKYVHKVLVNRLGGLSLPRKSVVRLTDRPDMTLDVYRGRKTTMQQQIYFGS